MVRLTKSTPSDPCPKYRQLEPNNLPTNSIQIGADIMTDTSNLSNSIALS